MNTAPRVVVVGAGISGLTAAYRVAQLVPAADVVVLESDARAGGKILTTPFAGLPAVDEAADAFLARVPHAVDLCRELGLADQLVTPAARSAYVWRHGALHRFPEGLVLGVPTDLDALAASGVISSAGVARAAEDLTMPGTDSNGHRAGDDETVGELVRRRVGDEIFDVLVAPLLSGVNAGDANELSVALGAPQLAAAVRDQPSLIAGLRAQREATMASASGDAPVFYGLRAGTATLIDALVHELAPGAVRLGCEALAITPMDRGGWEIGFASTNDTSSVGTIEADGVVVATPTYRTASLLQPLAPDVAADLSQLEWASVVLVTIAVPRSSVAHPLDGSGFLVAEGEGLLMTACSWGSSKWAHWSSGDTVVLRVSAGRHHDRRALDLSDTDLCGALVNELGTTIGLDAPADSMVTRVSHWQRALPQFRPGHQARASHWKQAAGAVGRGLELTGAGYSGLGIPACIADATAAATRLADLVF